MASSPVTEGMASAAGVSCMFLEGPVPRITSHAVQAPRSPQSRHHPKTPAGVMLDTSTSPEFDFAALNKGSSGHDSPDVLRRPGHQGGARRRPVSAVRHRGTAGFAAFTHQVKAGELIVPRRQREAGVISVSVWTLTILGATPPSSLRVPSETLPSTAPACLAPCSLFEVPLAGEATGWNRASPECRSATISPCASHRASSASSPQVPRGRLIVMTSRPTVPQRTAGNARLRRGCTGRIYW